MLFLKNLLLSATLLVAHVTALTNITSISYCPFEVKIAPSDDPKSLDLTYTPTSTPIRPDFFNGLACLVEVRFELPDERGDVYLEEIEYNSNKKMSIETQLGWENNNGPTRYEPVSITDGKPAIARNSTWNTFPFCIQTPHSFRITSFYLQTKFSDANVRPNFVLEQKAKLRFGESRLCSVIDECDQPDIDMKFPACHDVVSSKQEENGID
ncbi:hypothetical protein B0J11DRAFT_512433 [Dendryphion nanum]|uniref:Ubiquitin 3 binding protein But2 C-terminal domain-containing protein n=1 Tax=Dendryphion nanum TaxID=256645 RepID=A0A9P9D118_9PLEO|nr:hypothetical protein B0J11DRAFT_512433 [Dendryphion nanum]